MSVNGHDEMPPQVSRGGPDGASLGRLRIAALIALLAGAAGTAVFFLRAGQRTPRFLLLLMAIWVFSPLVALMWANAVSKGWSVLTRASLYVVMMVVALGSLAIYVRDALGPPHAQAAFVYVAVPPASWLLMALAISIAAFLSRRQSGRGDGA